MTDSSIADSRQSRVAMPGSRHTVLLSSALLHFADELGVHLCRFSETINMLLKCQLYFLPILSNLVFLMPKYRQNKEMPKSSAFFCRDLKSLLSVHNSQTVRHEKITSQKIT